MASKEAMRTQTWDWEGTWQTHETIEASCGVRKGLHAKTERCAREAQSLQLQNFLRLRESLPTPPRCDSAPELREVSNNGRDAAKGGRVYHDLAAATPVDRPP